jgi:hypothetical protein
MSGLTEDELQVLAERRHLPLIIATELAAELLKTPKGTWQLRSCLVEALELSVARGDRAREEHLRDLVGSFTQAHPIPPVV